MARVLASLFLVLLLPGCAITPPSSVFASLNDQPNPPPKREPAPAPVTQNTAQDSESGIGASLGGMWDSVKSGLSFESSTKAKVVPSSTGPVIPMDPVVAQQLVNTYRVQKGLKPLKLNPKLSAAANAHSEDLAKSDRISHYGSDGSDAWDRVNRTGYRARVTAENVGTGQRSVNEVFVGWQNSSGHNANLLLADAEEMGIAMVYKPDTHFKTFWTLVLGAQN